MGQAPDQEVRGCQERCCPTVLSAAARDDNIAAAMSRKAEEYWRLEMNAAQSLVAGSRRSHLLGSFVAASRSSRPVGFSQEQL